MKKVWRKRGREGRQEVVRGTEKMKGKGLRNKVTRGRRKAEEEAWRKMRMKNEESMVEKRKSRETDGCEREGGEDARKGLRKK